MAPGPRSSRADKVAFTFLSLESSAWAGAGSAWGQHLLWSLFCVNFSYLRSSQPSDPPSPDQPEVGGRHPLFFLHLLLPGTHGLDPPGRTRRALPLPRPRQGGPGDAPLTSRALPPRCLLLGRRFLALSAAPAGRRGPRSGRDPGQVPSCCRRERSGGSPLRRPSPAGAAPSGRRERSRGVPGLPGSRGSRSGCAFHGRRRRPRKHGVARCSSDFPLPDFILFFLKFHCNSMHFIFLRIIPHVVT